jgi:glycosyltransferase involved in cell wall biosynthesis
MHVLTIPYNYPTVDFPQRAIFISDQVNALKKNGNKVSVLGCIPRTITDLIKIKKLCFGQVENQPWLISVPAIRGLGNFNDFLSLNIGKYLFKKYIKKELRPDIVHVHNSTAAKLALWIKRKYGIPYVITEHSSQLWDISSLDKQQFSDIHIIYKESKGNIAVSELFGKHLNHSFNVIFQYIPNVVDTDFFVPSSGKKVKNSIIKVCTIGNLTKNKNHALLVNAIKTLKNNGFNMQLVIAGDGLEMGALLRQVKTLELIDNVKFVGEKSRTGVLKLLQESDYFILPSKKETFGIVLIEAMSCGLPVLSLNNGGSESIVTSSVGIITEHESLFCDSIVALMERQFSSGNIRKHALEKFSAKVVASKLQNIYLS